MPVLRDASMTRRGLTSTGGDHQSSHYYDAISRAQFRTLGSRLLLIAMTAAASRADEAPRQFSSSFSYHLKFH